MHPLNSDSDLEKTSRNPFFGYFQWTDPWRHWRYKGTTDPSAVKPLAIPSQDSVMRPKTSWPKTDFNINISANNMLTIIWWCLMMNRISRVESFILVSDDDGTSTGCDDEDVEDGQRWLNEDITMFSDDNQQQVTSGVWCKKWCRMRRYFNNSSCQQQERRISARLELLHQKSLFRWWTAGSSRMGRLTLVCPIGISIQFQLWTAHPFQSMRHSCPAIMPSRQVESVTAADFQRVNKDITDLIHLESSIILLTIWLNCTTRIKMAGVGTIAYNAIFRRTSTFVAAAVFTAFFMERGVDSATDYIFDNINRGVTMTFHSTFH